MTSAWNEPPGRDDRTGGGEDAGPDGGDMFEIGEHSGSGEQSAASGTGSRHVERDVEIVSPSAVTRDFLDLGGSGSDELRRLEESIRWLMDAGNVRHLPPVLTQPAGPSPLESKRYHLYHDDSLILDPETLFPPRSPQRQGDILRGAAKILLVSAIAAPAAYFAASWAQLPNPLDPPASSAAAPAGSVQVAALDTVPAAPPPEVTTRSIDIATAAPPEHVAAPVVEKTLVAGAGPAELKVAPPEQPSTSVPVQSARGDAETASLVIPVAAPPKPTLRAEEVTLMIQRGRSLFDAGDVVAARLFFRRAASAGDAGAAIALGATYDPEVLSQRFIRGIEANAQEAQKWYDKARALGGSGGGSSRIEMLAHR